jgi:hypothetical protein
MSTTIERSRIEMQTVKHFAHIAEISEYLASKPVRVVAAKAS